MTIPHNPDRLVAEHVRLARRLALLLSRSLPAFVDPDALESDAMLGLVQAARTFDAGRGVSFATYATLRIRGAMLDGLRERQHLRTSKAIPRMLSLSLPVGWADDGRPDTLEDRIAADQEPVGAEAERRDEIDWLLSRAGTRGRRELECYYLEGERQERIATRFGLSASRISQRLSATRRRLMELACPSSN